MHKDPTNTLVITLMSAVSRPTRTLRIGDPYGQVDTPRSTALPLPRRFSPQRRASARYSPHGCLASAPIICSPRARPRPPAAAFARLANDADHRCCRAHAPGLIGEVETPPRVSPAPVPRPRRCATLVRTEHAQNLDRIAAAISHLTPGCAMVCPTLSPSNHGWHRP